MKEQAEDVSNRFEIRHLFYAIAIYASALSFWGNWGWIPATLFLAAIAIVHFSSNRQRKGRAAETILVAVILLMFVLFTVRSSSRLRATAWRTSCMNNTRQLILAMHNYQSAMLKLPDAAENGPDGNPWHSWRCRLMPYLEHSNFYGKYTRSEPWNGPNNAAILRGMSPIYSCPGNPTQTTTPYKVIAGTDTAFDKHKPFRFNNPSIDSFSSIIVLVEDIANPVDWLSPQDLTVDEAVAILSSSSVQQCAHCIENSLTKKLQGTCVGMLDGSSCIIPPGTSPEIIRQAINPYDGIEPDLSDLPDAKITIIKYHGFISLTVFLILVILPIIRAFNKIQPEDLNSLGPKPDDEVDSITNTSEPDQDAQ